MPNEHDILVEDICEDDRLTIISNSADFDACEETEITALSD